MNKSLLIVFKSFILPVTLALITKPGLLLAANADNGHISAQQSQQLLNVVEWSPVPGSALSSLRGGFVLPNGMIVDISFEKQVFQNGVETFSSYFQSPENFSLIRDGEFNITSGLDDTAMQSVIQNDLDDQLLQTINTINVDIKNLNSISNSYNNKVLFYTQFVLPNISQ